MFSFVHRLFNRSYSNDYMFGMGVEYWRRGK